MSLKNVLKSTLFYKYIYQPYMIKKSKNVFQRKRHLFIKEGDNALKAFVECMKMNSVTYWLEFGSLLGAYRDGTFVPNEIDIDAGVFLKDAGKVYESLTNNGFKLVREFHIVGENGLEQTYEYNGTTIDVMYFFEKENLYWCNGVNFLPNTIKKGKLSEYVVTAHFFNKFDCTTIKFLGIEVSIPSNVEEHLSEIYGSGFRVYDPNFKGDLNKIYYDSKVKKAIGFIYY